MKGSRGSSEIDVGGLLNAVRSGNRHQFSRITASVANAFGDDSALHPHAKPPSSSKKLLLKVSSTNELNFRRKRDTFLTGTDVVEVEEPAPIEEVEEVKEKEMTLEDMVRDLDDFSKNVMGDYDDLAEVRRRIAACRRGIDQQTVNTYKLKQNIQDLDDRNQDFLEGRPSDMKRSKSYGRLQTRTNARKITAKSILARRGIGTAPSKQERVRETQTHLKQWMRNKINRNMTRNPFQRREIEARNIRTISQDARFIKKPPDEPDPFKAHLSLSHRAQPEGISVLNLPKQPFGMHKTYNETADFVQKHVVLKEEPLSPQKAKQLDEVIRQFRLCQKKDNSKMYRAVTQGPGRPRLGSLDSGKQEYDEFMTATGRLWCPREKHVEEAYNEQKKKYQSVDLGKSSDLEESLLRQLRKIRTPLKASPFHRLYAEGFRERRTTEMSERLSTKYADLFHEEKRPRRRLGSLDMKVVL